MNLPSRLAAFTLALGVVFAATYGAGTLAGPMVSDQAGHQMAGGQNAAGHEAGSHGTEPTARSGPGGLAVSADGYTLRQLSAAPVAGQPAEYAFQILDAAAPVTRFQVSHDKQLHLIVVRRDLTGFQHLHPQLSPDGTWRTPLTCPRPATGGSSPTSGPTGATGMSSSASTCRWPGTTGRNRCRSRRRPPASTATPSPSTAT